MSNSYFQFKQFTIQQDRCAMKVTTDACLFGALVAEKTSGLQTLPKKILDIGTGTGLLSLMFAQKNFTAEIDAIEKDKEAFEQAKENIAASPWLNRIKVFHADARSFDFPNKYDLIISNPPFYESELKSLDTRKNIAHHNEGLLLPELFLIIKNNLNPDGIFILLLPYKRNAEAKELLLKHDLIFFHKMLVRQSINHDYFRIMLIGKLKKDELIETKIDEISICDDKQQYTPGFIELLKDYYLHL